MLWLLAVVTSAILFVYVMVNRLLLFYEYTSKVDVEKTYVDQLAFPAVTVCNHNQFRYVVSAYWNPLQYQDRLPMCGDVPVKEQKVII